MKNSQEHIKVGILFNPDYIPSLLASTHICNILKKTGIEMIMLSIEDLIGDKKQCDIVLNVYYGEIGDGGIVSGILEQQHIAFIGNSQYACALMMNKVVSKMLLGRSGYLTPPFWYKPNVQKSDVSLVHEITNAVRYPILAKPVNGAASENIHFINNSDKLSVFLTKFRFLIDSGYYFFEQFIEGRELSAGYVDAIGKSLPVIEIKLKGEKYQSNRVKFSPGLKENTIPANVSSTVYQQAQKIARDLHDVFYCSAFSRTDIIYDEENEKLYVLEINTNPGLLEKSLLPLMVKTLGINDGEFFTRLIYHSLEKKV